MAIIVSFVRPSRGSLELPGIGIGNVRAMEVLEVGETTEGVSEAGEFIVIGNAEDSMIVAAIGNEPDAMAESSTTQTTAGYPIPSGSISDPFVGKLGDKVNVKAAG